MPWEIHFEATEEATTLPWRAQVERRDDRLQSLQPNASGLTVEQGSAEYLTWSFIQVMDIQLLIDSGVPTYALQKPTLNV